MHHLQPPVRSAELTVIRDALPEPEGTVYLLGRDDPELVALLEDLASGRYRRFTHPDTPDATCVLIARDAAADAVHAFLQRFGRLTEVDVAAILADEA